MTNSDTAAAEEAGISQPEEAKDAQDTGENLPPEEAAAGLERQISEERGLLKEKIAELERTNKERDASHRECESLNDRLSFIASVIESEPEHNSCLDRFSQLLDGDYLSYAIHRPFQASAVSALKTLQEVRGRLELMIRDPQILGKSIIAVGGAFSSGKSSFINSFFSEDDLTLPVGMDQTTAIASYVLDGGNTSTEITGYSCKGGKVKIPERIFSLFTYRKKDEFKFNMKSLIDDIVIRTKFVCPFKHICFVDTPGFNPGSGSELDFRTAFSAISGAQALLWCFDVNSGTLHDDELKVLQNIKDINPDIRIYIIANRADLKSMEENEEILSQVEMLLQSSFVEYEGISLYTSNEKFDSQPDDYAAAAMGESIADFLSDNNKPDTRKQDELLKRVTDVFDEQIEADGKRISETKERLQAISSIENSFQEILGKKDEAILQYKSRVSTKTIRNMQGQNSFDSMNTDRNVDAVSEGLGKIKGDLQAVLQNSISDKATVEELRGKFSDCLKKLFDSIEMQAEPQQADSEAGEELWTGYDAKPQALGADGRSPNHGKHEAKASSGNKNKAHDTWQKLQKSARDRSNVTGVIKGRVKGGFTVDIAGISAFLPGSLLDVHPVKDVSHLMGRELQFRIKEIDPKQNNMVVSRKDALEDSARKNRENTIVRLKLQEGQIVNGTVRKITDYGAFIDIGGVDGLLYIKEMSWKPIKHPSEIVRIGEEIKVKVIKIDHEQSRVSLGLKQLEMPASAGQTPAQSVSNVAPDNNKVNDAGDALSNLKEGQTVKGIVRKITYYGAFVDIGGVNGLLHIRDMSWKHLGNPSEVVKTGQEINVKILKIDREHARASLGLKQLTADPWNDIARRYPVGTKISGKVTGIAEFGCFVEIEPGVEGLLHVSEMGGNNRNVKPSDIFHVDQMVQAKVIVIDEEKRRIALSIRQCKP